MVRRIKIMISTFKLLVNQVVTRKMFDFKTSGFFLDEEGEEGQQNKEKEEDLLKQLFQYLPDELQNQFLEMYKSMGLEKAAANFATIIDQQE